MNALSDQLEVLNEKVAELGTEIKPYSERRAKTAEDKADTLQQLKRQEAKTQKLIDQWNDLQLKLSGGKPRLTSGLGVIYIKPGKQDLALLDLRMNFEICLTCQQSASQLLVHCSAQRSVSCT